MKIRNNNRKIIHTLSKASYKSNKSRNRLLIGAIAATVLVIFSISSVMKGRINAEYLMEVRHNGSNASTQLENPTQEQIKAVKKLPYIKNVGSINYFANARTDGLDRFICMAVDKNAYKEIYLPAYTDVRGVYPTKMNQLMLSIRGLHEIGITKPVLGMDITVDIYIDNTKTETQTFQLSGYYTEYVHPIEGPPIGFFSNSYLNKCGFNMETPTSLLIQQNNLFAGEKIEEKLYNDIDTKNDVQRFRSENSVNYNVIQKTVGGYDIAIVGILLILTCAFFLNYNVMNISVNKDMQYYGLLKTLGATNRQIRATIYFQTIKIALYGCAFGTLLSCILVLGLLPKLLSKYYLYNYGVSSQIISFHPELMAGSIIAAIILAFVSILLPAWRAGQIVPVESVKYTDGNKKKTHSVRTGKGETRIFHISWRNILRNKQTMIITTLSLFVGLSVALSSLVITRGLDYTNNFLLLPDFQFDAPYNPLNEDYDKDVMPITPEDVTYFQSLDGVTKVNVTYGDYILTSPDSLIWQPYINGYINNFVPDSAKETSKEEAKQIKGNFYSTILLADEAFVKEFEKYINKNNLKVDMESFKNGQGAICIDGYLLSRKSLENSQSTIGAPIEIRNTDNNILGNLKFAGYINKAKKNCPPIGVTMKLFGPDLIITEAAYEKLGLTKRPLRTTIDTTDEREPQIKAAMKRLMDAKRNSLPPSEQDSKLPFLDINSDDLAAAQDELQTMKIAMYTVSSLLIILGLFNYLNTTFLGLWGRRREIAIMESIGITRKQLRQMLVMEGIYYSLIVSGLVTTIGSGIMYGIFKIVHARLGYAKFYFPFVPIGIIILIVFTTCICVPLIMYKKIADESVIERLRVSGE